MAQKKFISIASSTSAELTYSIIKAKRDLRKINKMLKALQVEDYYKESTAVENIFNYLGESTISVGKTKKGLISIRGIKNKSQTQLTSIEKTINEFIKNPTSTIAGMEKLYEERLDELRKFIDDKEFVNSLTYHDVKTIYGFFNAKEYEKNEKRFPSKEMYVLFTKTLSEKWGKEKFMLEVEKYIDTGNDENLKTDLETLYNNYLSGYANRK